MIHEHSDSSNCQCESLARHESALNRTFCPQGMGGGYRSCSFDSSTCSLISDLDTKHARALGCTTVHEQIIKNEESVNNLQYSTYRDTFCWWLATPIGNQMNSLLLILAMGETCIMCKVAVWFAKPCRENFTSEVLLFNFLLLLSAWADSAVGF